MKGLHRSFFHHLIVLLLIISGSALPEINFAPYRRNISANPTSRSNIADERMAVIHSQIGNISLTEYQFIDLPVSLKTEKMKFLFRLHLNQPSTNSLPT